jgi:hypothetical protein
LNSILNSSLNPPSPAEAIKAQGFTRAAGIRVIAIQPGSTDVSPPPGALDLLAEFR